MERVKYIVIVVTILNVKFFVRISLMYMYCREEPVIHK